MLMLTRHPGESVDLIDRDTRRVIATVQVLALLPNDNVRLGFRAPESVLIVRDNAKRRTENGNDENEENGTGD